MDNLAFWVGCASCLLGGFSLGTWQEDLVIPGSICVVIGGVLIFIGWGS